MPDPRTLVDLRAALEREPRVNLHRDLIDTSFEGETVVLSGEVTSIAAKRNAARTVAEFGLSVDDRLRIRREESRDDGAIKDSLVAAFQNESVFRNCHITIHWHDQHEVVANAESDGPCILDFTITEGSVTLQGMVWSLSHRRLAEALTWWSPGVSDVTDRLEVNPAERDNDDEITDALRLVLDKDPLIRSGQLYVSTDDGVVTLEGMVREDSEKENAESDAWYLFGVRQVVNRIEVRHGSPRGE